MCELLLLHCIDECFSKVSVDLDVSCAKSNHSQRILVKVGQGDIVVCVQETSK